MNRTGTTALCVLTLGVVSGIVLTPGCMAREPRAGGETPTSTGGAVRPERATPGAGGVASERTVAQGNPAKTVGLIQYPSVSPDGKSIVFAWLADLWIVNSNGGGAQRLTAHPGEERRSAWSPDGKSIAFESDRDGGRNLFVMDLTSEAGEPIAGAARRITTLDRAVSLSGFSNDGASVLFSGNLDATLFRSTRMYKAAVDGSGSKPIGKLTEAFGGTPRMSADGARVTFTRGRPDLNRPKYQGSGNTDVFEMRTGDGNFTRLTKHPALDADAFPMPDGSTVFVSSRTGVNNVYRLAAGSDEGKAEQLTSFSATPEQITIGHGVRDLSVNATGTLAAFVVWDTLYTLDLTARGTAPLAVRVVASPDAQDGITQRINLAREVSEAALSPDGKTLAVIARGEVFVRSTDENRPTRRVTSTHGRERGLAWSPDGRVLWFSSDESGVSQVYYATVALAREDISPKEDEPKKDEDAKKSDEPKKNDDAKDEAKKDEPAKDDDAKKDDAKKDDGEKKPDADKKEPAKKKIDYSKRWQESLRFDVKHLDTSMIPTGRNDGVLGQEVRSPAPSPDGTKLIVQRGLGDLVLLDLKARTAKVLLESWNEPDVQWAADSRHIVYGLEDLDFNNDIFLMDTMGEAGSDLARGINLTRHPDLDSSPRLSADGKVLYFLSERGNENFVFDVYTLFLDKKIEALRGYELDEYFKKAAETAGKRKPIDPVLWDEAEKKDDEKKPDEAAAGNDAPKADAGDTKADAKPPEKDGVKSADAKPKKAKAVEPLKFDVQDSHLRVRRVFGSLGNKGSLAITPAGERVLFVGDADTERALYSISFKGDDRKTVSPGAAGGIEVSLNGSKVSFVRTGTVSLTTPPGGKVDAMPIDAPVVIDVAKQQRQKFLEASRIMGNGFYHPTLKGLNWKGLNERYLSLAQRTRTPGEFDRVFEQLLGELDGSHTGITSPPAGGAGSAQAIGYLGIDASPAPGGYRVDRVIFQGPADRENAKLRAGDVITTIEGEPLSPDANALPTIDLHAAMSGRAGKETLIVVERAQALPALPGTILVIPSSAAEDNNTRYADEVRGRAKKVDELSKGRLGYLHIRSMSQPSVDDFERDLFAAASGKDGLIIDVRDNGGGSTADILLSSLTAPNHAWTVPRGADPKATPRDAYPRDRRLIYGYSRPINVLINENSFSNAEIFAHAIKTIKRGTLVGTRTFGGVISTGAASLIDGTTIRTPFRGWYLPDGTDYENNGASPDINVEKTPQDEAAGRDAQLEAAVKELLGRVAK